MSILLLISFQNSFGVPARLCQEKGQKDAFLLANVSAGKITVSLSLLTRALWVETAGSRKPNIVSMCHDLSLMKVKAIFQGTLKCTTSSEQACYLNTRHKQTLRISTTTKFTNTDCYVCGCLSFASMCRLLDGLSLLAPYANLLCSTTFDKACTVTYLPWNRTLQLHTRKKGEAHPHCYSSTHCCHLLVRI